jgi:peptidyl-prolyl cis-trans isomerase C
MKNLSLLLTCLLIASLACNLIAEEENDKDATKPENTAETAADSVAVTVNGTDITESQVNEEIKPQLEKLAAQAAQMPPAFLEQYKTQIRQQALERMVVEKLLDQKAKQLNLQVTDEEVMKKIEEMAAQQNPPLSMEDFKALIEAYGQSLEEVKGRIRKGIGYQKIVEAQFEGKINVTEEDAKKFYDENPKEFETPEQVRASHILIKTQPADSNEVKAEAKQKIEQLLKQVQDDADFAQLAKENSTCPSSEKGGDLGFFPREQMVPAFEKVAFELKPGQVSDVVETRFGYHIIKVTDRKDASLTSFDDAKDGIINNLENKKKGEIAAKYIESLEAEANIVYPPGKEPQTPPTPPAVTP